MSVNLEDLKERIQSEIPKLEAFKSKDVVHLIGKSGTGKSSFINFLQGRKLIKYVREEILDDGTVVLGKSYVDMVVPVEGFRIGHECNGCTATLNSCRIKGSELLAADSCGFDDPKSVIDAGIDIVNAVSLKNAMALSNSIRPVMS